MSRTLAAVLHGVVTGLTSLEGRRRGAMTQARLVERLETDSIHAIETAHGAIRCLPIRGPHLAAAALGFADEEPELLAWIDGFPPGARFWDIGAATGLFSMYAARRGAQVTAFEPKATSFGVLVEHLAMNGLTRLSLSAMAAGTGGNSVDGHPNQFGQHASVFEQGTMAYRIDDFVAAFGLAPPDYVKIDVDGVEALILKGAPETLKSVKGVMVEVEGDNAVGVDRLIGAPLADAGLLEDVTVRGRGSGRNRLYVRD